MKTAVWLVCLGVVLGGLGCKKGHDDVKKQAIAIRDKALACKDAKCASSASDEYVALTKDLSGLSDADAKLIGDIAIEIRTHETKLAPPASSPPASPPAAAKPTEAAAPPSQRVQGRVFSLVLAPGWKLEKPPADSVLLAASNGAQNFGVIALSGSFAVDDDDACRTGAAKIMGGMKTTSLASAVVDAPGGKGCQVLAAADNQQFASVIFRSPEGAPFQVTCIVPDKSQTLMCLQMLASWKFEATAPAASARERVTGPGFSFALPPNWTSQPQPDRLAAAATIDGERRVSVLRVGKPIEIATKKDCDAFGEALKTNLKATESTSMAIDGPTGPMCSSIHLVNKMVMMFSIYKAPSGNPYQMLCVIRETDGNGAKDCSAIWKSFAFEK